MQNVLIINIFLDFNTFFTYNCVKDQHLIKKFNYEVKFMENENKFKKFICSGLGKAGMIIIIYAVVFLLILGLGQLLEGASVYAGAVVGLIFAFFGWKALNKITPDIFLWMSIMGWVVYFLIKGLLSIFIGFFVAPYVIAKMVAEAIQKSMSE